MKADKENLINDKDIAKLVSKEVGIPYETVISINRNFTKYIAHVMEHSGFEAVKIPYLGKFMVKTKRLQYYNEKKVRQRSDGII